jgi:hypothetical protein
MKTLVGIFVGLVTLISITWVNTAQAIPAFARKYEKSCSSCHNAWPLLNKAGRTFKEAGYRFPSEDKHSQKIKGITWGKSFPVSVMLVARPYDKKDTAKDPKLRAMHEIELLVAGAMGKKWSGFIEYEAEDEGNFELEYGHAALSWNYSKALNVQFTYGPALFADSYDTYGMRRLTRGRAYIIDNAFGGADNGGKLRTNRQQVSLYGRPISNLFYSVGYSGASGDSEGEAPGTVHARVAWDVMPKIMVGLFHLSGTCDAAVGAPNCAVDRDFKRTGIDVQADVNNFRFTAAFLSAEDDVALVTEDNDVYFVQGLYVHRKDKRPTWTALLRYDNEEGTNGTLERKAWTANVGYYFKENVRGFVEFYSENKNTIDPTAKHDRVTLQLVVGF